MCTKTGALRWIFLDEVKATGTEVTGQLEQNVRFHGPAKSPFKYKDKQIRPFGGVNVCCLGVFWQLRPTGQIALMSNPFAVKSAGKCKSTDNHGNVLVFQSVFLNAVLSQQRASRTLK